MRQKNYADIFEYRTEGLFDAFKAYTHTKVVTDAEKGIEHCLEDEFRNDLHLPEVQLDQ